MGCPPTASTNPDHVGQQRRPRGPENAGQLSAERPIARCQIDFDLAGLPAQARVELEPGIVFSRPAKEYRDAVAATANIALNSSMTKGEAGFADFGIGLRYFTTALLLHALEATAPDLPEDAESLHRAALRVISMRATGPDFTVESLAHAIGTSSRTLREVFARPAARLRPRSPGSVCDEPAPMLPRERTANDSPWAKSLDSPASGTLAPSAAPL